MKENQERYFFPKTHLLYFLIVLYVILLSISIYSILIGNFTINMIHSLLFITTVIFMIIYSLYPKQYLLYSSILLYLILVLLTIYFIYNGKFTINMMVSLLLATIVIITKIFNIKKLKKRDNK
ncbi:hypothetical protein [Methanocaldococcus sp.]|uniref:hypothetical protein n=1 Tax=Methanocaldococcus sp. TaxID=2152917 RepID=UPI002639D3DF|nr:hypothetical protein [Methanocaldococcus sp.]MCQ6253351.1 hypothetical protein [Methanocaldococcus sp.]